MPAAARPLPPGSSASSGSGRDPFIPGYCAPELRQQVDPGTGLSWAALWGEADVVPTAGPWRSSPSFTHPPRPYPRPAPGPLPRQEQRVWSRAPAPRSANCPPFAALSSEGAEAPRPVARIPVAESGPLVSVQTGALQALVAGEDNWRRHWVGAESSRGGGVMLSSSCTSASQHWWGQRQVAVARGAPSRVLACRRLQPPPTGTSPPPRNLSAARRRGRQGRTRPRAASSALGKPLDLQDPPLGGGEPVAAAGAESPREAAPTNETHLSAKRAASSQDARLASLPAACTEKPLSGSTPKKPGGTWNVGEGARDSDAPSLTPAPGSGDLGLD